MQTGFLHFIKHLLMYTMKTTLPANIESLEQAKKYLTDLHANGEHYNPDDPVADCFEVSEATATQMDQLMEQVFKYFNEAGECPYGFILDLINNSDEI